MIGDRLKNKRLSLHLSRAEMAEKIGCSAQYYSRLERNLEVPRLGRLIEIADTLDMPVGGLINQPPKYLRRTPKGYVCTALSCSWRDANNVCHAGAGCLKEWEEQQAEQTHETQEAEK